MECKTIKIKSSHPASQGAFVEINEGDFDEAKGHERYIDAPPASVPPPPVLDAPPGPVDPLAGLAADWRDKPTEDVKALAFAIDGRAVENREQAIAVIEAALAQRGPTVAEWVAAGYRAVNYPPTGYVSKSTPEEIAAAIAAQG